MGSGMEIIDFNKPHTSRKNLFVTNIPGTLSDADIVVELYKVFSPFGLLYGVQVFPTQLRFNKVSEQEASNSKGNNIQTGYYAFVTFYSHMEAARAKEALNSVILIQDNECKIAYAKRKGEAQESQVLYVTRCYDLVNHYLGFNSWAYNIKTIFEDQEARSEAGDTVSLQYVCVVELTVCDLTTDGVGLCQETYTGTNPMSKLQAVCRCKKLCQHRALENAFSKLLLVVLADGRVHVEVDTTRPDLLAATHAPHDNLIQVNELCSGPLGEGEEEGRDSKAGEGLARSVLGNTEDDINLHILQELEDDMG